jgi:hypothetical protein
MVFTISIAITNQIIMDTETIGTIEFIALTLSWNKKNSKLVIQVQKGYVYGYVCLTSSQSVPMILLPLKL